MVAECRKTRQTEAAAVVVLLVVAAVCATAHAADTGLRCVEHAGPYASNEAPAGRELVAIPVGTRGAKIVVMYGDAVCSPGEVVAGISKARVLDNIPRDGGAPVTGMAGRVLGLTGDDQSYIESFQNFARRLSGADPVFPFDRALVSPAGALSGRVREGKDGSVEVLPVKGVVTGAGPRPSGPHSNNACSVKNPVTNIYVTVRAVLAAAQQALPDARSVSLPIYGIGAGRQSCGYCHPFLYTVLAAKNFLDSNPDGSIKTVYATVFADPGLVYNPKQLQTFVSTSRDVIGGQSIGAVCDREREPANHARGLVNLGATELEEAMSTIAEVGDDAPGAHEATGPDEDEDRVVVSAGVNLGKFNCDQSEKVAAAWMAALEDFADVLADVTKEAYDAQQKPPAPAVGARPEGAAAVPRKKDLEEALEKVLGLNANAAVRGAEVDDLWRGKLQEMLTTLNGLDGDGVTHDDVQRVGDVLMEVLSAELKIKELNEDAANQPL